MLYVIEGDLAAGMLVGVFGCGKTVISQVLYDRLTSDRYKVAHISNPQLNHVELLRAIVHRLKAIELPMKTSEVSTEFLLETLENILELNDRDGKETVLIVDEAHVINDERVFEELRLLMNFQKRDKFLLKLLLFGQPELKQKVEDNKQLDQRIAIRCQIGPFNNEDTHKYIMHRLRIAGVEAPIFDESAFNLIYSNSGGIPRRINQICALSLLTGFAQGAKRVDEKIVKESLHLSGALNFSS